MAGFWEGKFNELASFNAEEDKEKYTAAYLDKMNKLQNEYDLKSAEWFKSQGYIVM